MNIITTTALSNFRKNKSRNILIGFAIALTTLLLTVVPTVVLGFTQIQFQAVENIYPTFHAMYRNVAYSAAQEMKEDKIFEEVGLREDPAYMYCENNPDVVIPMVAVDETALRLNKQELAEGSFPKKPDEIVVSRGLLETMGLSGNIGDTIEVPFQPVTGEGMGMAQTKTFVITGFTEDVEEAVEKGMYAAYVSGDFAGEIMEQSDRAYRVYIRLADSEGKLTDTLEKEFKEAGESYGVAGKDIVNNGEYLTVMYVDPAFYGGVAIVLAVVMIAGILTIYSIYYVSMLDKVQEYGRLRAIGATKRQIRQLVFREGFAVYVLAMPVGIILGLVVGISVMSAMIHNMPGSADNFLIKAMEQVWGNKEVTLIKWQVILFAVAVSLVTVYVSLLRPMQVAGKVSAIEAIRFQNTGKSKKKIRKGYKEISTRKLTAVNLGRNKKRTVITIFSLGMTGIMFIVIATVISCINPSVIADDAVRGDISVTIDSWEDDEMHPERALKNIQKNNPMTDELKAQIEGIDGVEEVETTIFARAEFPGLKEEDGRPYQTGISGISDKILKESEKYVVEGSLDDPALDDGTGIIIDSAYVKLYPEANHNVGDTLRMKIEDGESKIEKEFRIVALVQAPNSLIRGWFNMKNDTLQEMCQADLTDRFNIWAEEGKEKTVAEEVGNLIEAQEFLEMSTWQEQYEAGQEMIGYIVYGCYGMLLVFGLIGILNLINTMINSVHVRQKEIGMMQAIGMSARQTVNMLQMEGLFYTAGTLALSLGVGSLAGYGVFLWAREEQLMSIKFYHYPVLPAIILSLTVLIVQLLVTYLINKNLKRQSLIERIRLGTG